MNEYTLAEAIQPALCPKHGTLECSGDKKLRMKAWYVLSAACGWHLGQSQSLARAELA